MFLNFNKIHDNYSSFIVKYALRRLNSDYVSSIKLENLKTIDGSEIEPPYVLDKCVIKLTCGNKIVINAEHHYNGLNGTIYCPKLDIDFIFNTELEFNEAIYDVGKILKKIRQNV